jgi:HK97 family phage prohead protease
VDFKLYTNALKAYTAENGDLHVVGTTSSTIRDLHGDEMTLSALKSMEDTAKQNMTVFLNHNYNVPDDIFGSVTDARIVKRFDDDSGQEVYDLDVDVRVVGEDENPLAMKTYRAIKRGVKLGLSIGARVDKVSKKKGNGGEETYVIESVKLLETSVVGIPANQRSYLQNALKSLKQAEQSGEIEVVSDSADRINAPFTKAEAGSIAAGDWVIWASDEETSCGVVEYVMTEGTLGEPGGEYSIDATAEDPAALVRIYEGEDGDWEATELLVGQKVNALTKINPLYLAEEDEETAMSETEKDLVAEGVVEAATADEVIDAEKKTRVTVTVSTEGDKPADVAAPTAVAEEKEEDAAPEEVVASANSNDTAEEIVEKAVEPTPAPSPAPAPAPEPAPEPKPAEEPKAPVADEEKSSRYKSGVSDQVLAGISGILADLTDEDRDAVLAGLGVQKDGEPVVEEAPISDPEVTLEVVQEAPAEVAVEAASDVVAEDAAATSLEEVAAIAKSALDAAIAAQQEVVAVKSVVTELSAEKAKVEGELAKALDLVGRLINVPMGRKQVTINAEKSTNGEKAPWLDPFIARLLDAQE